MKRKVKLTELAKTILIIGALWLLFTGYLLLVSDRNQKIETGEIIQVSESYMK